MSLLSNPDSIDKSTGHVTSLSIETTSFCFDFFEEPNISNDIPTVNQKQFSLNLVNAISIDSNKSEAKKFNEQLNKTPINNQRTIDLKPSLNSKFNFEQNVDLSIPPLTFEDLFKEQSNDAFLDNSPMLNQNDQSFLKNFDFDIVPEIDSTDSHLHFELSLPQFIISEKNSDNQSNIEKDFDFHLSEMFYIDSDEPLLNNQGIQTDQFLNDLSIQNNFNDLLLYYPIPFSNTIIPTFSISKLQPIISIKNDDKQFSLSESSGFSINIGSLNEDQIEEKGQNDSTIGQIEIEEEDTSESNETNSNCLQLDNSDQNQTKRMFEIEKSTEFEFNSNNQTNLHTNSLEISSSAIHSCNFINDSTSFDIEYNEPFTIFEQIPIKYNMKHDLSYSTNNIIVDYQSHSNFSVSDSSLMIEIKDESNQLDYSNPHIVNIEPIQQQNKSTFESIKHSFNLEHQNIIDIEQNLLNENEFELIHQNITDIEPIKNQLNLINENITDIEPVDFVNEKIVDVKPNQKVQPKLQLSNESNEISLPLSHSNFSISTKTISDFYTERRLTKTQPISQFDLISHKNQLTFYSNEHFDIPSINQSLVISNDKFHSFEISPSIFVDHCISDSELKRMLEIEEPVIQQTTVPEMELTTGSICKLAFSNLQEIDTNEIFESFEVSSPNYIFTLNQNDENDKTDLALCFVDDFSFNVDYPSFSIESNSFDLIAKETINLDESKLMNHNYQIINHSIFDVQSFDIQQDRNDKLEYSQLLSDEYIFKPNELSLNKLDSFDLLNENVNDSELTMTEKSNEFTIENLNSFDLVNEIPKFEYSQLHSEEFPLIQTQQSKLSFSELESFNLLNEDLNDSKLNEPKESNELSMTQLESFDIVNEIHKLTANESIQTEQSELSFNQIDENVKLDYSQLHSEEIPLLQTEQSNQLTIDMVDSFDLNVQETTKLAFSQINQINLPQVEKETKELTINKLDSFDILNENLDDSELTTPKKSNELIMTQLDSFDVVNEIPKFEYSQLHSEEFPLIQTQQSKLSFSELDSFNLLNENLNDLKLNATKRSNELSMTQLKSFDIVNEINKLTANESIQTEQSELSFNQMDSFDVLNENVKLDYSQLHSEEIPLLQTEQSNQLTIDMVDSFDLNVQETTKLAFSQINQINLPQIEKETKELTINKLDSFDLLTYNIKDSEFNASKRSNELSMTQFESFDFTNEIHKLTTNESIQTEQSTLTFNKLESFDLLNENINSNESIQTELSQNTIDNIHEISNLSLTTESSFIFEQKPNGQIIDESTEFEFSSPIAISSIRKDSSMNQLNSFEFTTKRSPLENSKLQQFEFFIESEKPEIEEEESESSNIIEREMPKCTICPQIDENIFILNEPNENLQNENIRFTFSSLETIVNENESEKIDSLHPNEIIQSHQLELTRLDIISFEYERKELPEFELTSNEIISLESNRLYKFELTQPEIISFDLIQDIQSPKLELTGADIFYIESNHLAQLQLTQSEIISFEYETNDAELEISTNDVISIESNHKIHQFELTQPEFVSFEFPQNKIKSPELEISSDEIISIESNHLTRFQLTQPEIMSFDFNEPTIQATELELTSAEVISIESKSLFKLELTRPEFISFESVQNEDLSHEFELTNAEIISIGSNHKIPQFELTPPEFVSFELTQEIKLDLISADIISIESNHLAQLQLTQPEIISFEFETNNAQLEISTNEIISIESNHQIHQFELTQPEFVSFEYQQNGIETPELEISSNEIISIESNHLAKIQLTQPEIMSFEFNEAAIDLPELELTSAEVIYIESHRFEFTQPEFISFESESNNPQLEINSNEILSIQSQIHKAPVFELTKAEIVSFESPLPHMGFQNDPIISIPSQQQPHLSIVRNDSAIIDSVSTELPINHQHEIPSFDLSSLESIIEIDNQEIVCTTSDPVVYQFTENGSSQQTIRPFKLSKPTTISSGFYDNLETSHPFSNSICSLPYITIDNSIKDETIDGQNKHQLQIPDSSNSFEMMANKTLFEISQPDVLFDQIESGNSVKSDNSDVEIQSTEINKFDLISNPSIEIPLSQRKPSIPMFSISQTDVLFDQIELENSVTPESSDVGVQSNEIKQFDLISNTSIEIHQSTPSIPEFSVTQLEELIELPITNVPVSNSTSTNDLVNQTEIVNNIPEFSISPFEELIELSRENKNQQFELLFDSLVSIEPQQSRELNTKQSSIFTISVPFVFDSREEIPKFEFTTSTLVTNSSTVENDDLPNRNVDNSLVSNSPQIDLQICQQEKIEITDNQSPEKVEFRLIQSDFITAESYRNENAFQFTSQSESIVDIYDQMESPKFEVTEPLITSFELNQPKSNEICQQEHLTIDSIKEETTNHLEFTEPQAISIEPTSNAPIQCKHLKISAAELISIEPNKLNSFEFQKVEITSIEPNRNEINHSLELAQSEIVSFTPNENTEILDHSFEISTPESFELHKQSSNEISVKETFAIDLIQEETTNHLELTKPQVFSIEPTTEVVKPDLQFNEYDIITVEPNEIAQNQKEIQSFEIEKAPIFSYQPLKQSQNKLCVQNDSIIDLFDQSINQFELTEPQIISSEHQSIIHYQIYPQENLSIDFIQQVNNQTLQLAELSSFEYNNFELPEPQNNSIESDSNEVISKHQLALINNEPVSIEPIDLIEIDTQENSSIEIPQFSLTNPNVISLNKADLQIDKQLQQEECESISIPLFTNSISIDSNSLYTYEIDNSIETAMNEIDQGVQQIQTEKTLTDICIQTNENDLLNQNETNHSDKVLSDIVVIYEQNDISNSSSYVERLPTMNDICLQTNENDLLNQNENIEINSTEKVLTDVLTIYEQNEISNKFELSEIERINEVSQIKNDNSINTNQIFEIQPIQVNLTISSNVEQFDVSSNKIELENSPSIDFNQNETIAFELSEMTVMINEQFNSNENQFTNNSSKLTCSDFMIYENLNETIPEFMESELLNFEIENHLIQMNLIQNEYIDIINENHQKEFNDTETSIVFSQLPSINQNEIMNPTVDVVSRSITFELSSPESFELNKRNEINQKNFDISNQESFEIENVIQPPLHKFEFSIPQTLEIQNEIKYSTPDIFEVDNVIQSSKEITHSKYEISAPEQFEIEKTNNVELNYSPLESFDIESKPSIHLHSSKLEISTPDAIEYNNEIDSQTIKFDFSTLETFEIDTIIPKLDVVDHSQIDISPSKAVEPKINDIKFTISLLDSFEINNEVEIPSELHQNKFEISTPETLEISKEVLVNPSQFEISIPETITFNSETDQQNIKFGISTPETFELENVIESLDAVNHPQIDISQSNSVEPKINHIKFTISLLDSFEINNEVETPSELHQNQFEISSFETLEISKEVLVNHSQFEISSPEQFEIEKINNSPFELNLSTLESFDIENQLSIDVRPSQLELSIPETIELNNEIGHQSVKFDLSTPETVEIENQIDSPIVTPQIEIDPQSLYEHHILPINDDKQITLLDSVYIENEIPSFELSSQTVISIDFNNNTVLEPLIQVERPNLILDNLEIFEEDNSNEINELEINSQTELGPTKQQQNNEFALNTFEIFDENTNAVGEINSSNEEQANNHNVQLEIALTELFGQAQLTTPDLTYSPSQLIDIPSNELERNLELNDHFDISGPINIGSLHQIEYHNLSIQHQDQFDVSNQQIERILSIETSEIISVESNESILSNDQNQHRIELQIIQLNEISIEQPKKTELQMIQLDEFAFNDNSIQQQEQFDIEKPIKEFELSESVINSIDNERYQSQEIPYDISVQSSIDIFDNSNDISKPLSFESNDIFTQNTNNQLNLNNLLHQSIHQNPFEFSNLQIIYENIEHNTNDIKEGHHYSDEIEEEEYDNESSDDHSIDNATIQRLSISPLIEFSKNEIVQFEFSEQLNLSFDNHYTQLSLVSNEIVSNEPNQTCLEIGQPMSNKLEIVPLNGIYISSELVNTLNISLVDSFDIENEKSELNVSNEIVSFDSESLVPTFEESQLINLYKNEIQIEDQTTSQNLSIYSLPSFSIENSSNCNQQEQNLTIHSIPSFSIENISNEIGHTDSNEVENVNTSDPPHLNLLIDDLISFDKVEQIDLELTSIEQFDIINQKNETEVEFSNSIVDSLNSEQLSNLFTQKVEHSSQTELSLNLQITSNDLIFDQQSNEDHPTIHNQFSINKNESFEIINSNLINPTMITNSNIDIETTTQLKEEIEEEEYDDENDFALSDLQHYECPMRHQSNSLITSYNVQFDLQSTRPKLDYITNEIVDINQKTVNQSSIYSNILFSLDPQVHNYEIIKLGFTDIVPSKSPVDDLNSAEIEPEIHHFPIDNCDEIDIQNVHQHGVHDYSPVLNVSTIHHFSYSQIGFDYKPFVDLEVSDEIIELDLALQEETPIPIIHREHVNLVESEMVEFSLINMENQNDKSKIGLIKKQITTIKNLQTENVQKDVLIDSLKKKYDSLKDSARDCIAKHFQDVRRLTEQNGILLEQLNSLHMKMNANLDSSQDAMLKFIRQKNLASLKLENSINIFSIEPPQLVESEPDFFVDRYLETNGQNILVTFNNLDIKPNKNAVVKLTSNNEVHSYLPNKLYISNATASIEISKSFSPMIQTGKIILYSEPPKCNFVPLQLTEDNVVFEKPENKPQLSFSFSHMRISRPKPIPILHLEANRTVAHIYSPPINIEQSNSIEKAVTLHRNIVRNSFSICNQEVKKKNLCSIAKVSTFDIKNETQIKNDIEMNIVVDLFDDSKPKHKMNISHHHIHTNQPITTDTKKNLRISKPISHNLLRQLTVPKENRPQNNLNMEISSPEVLMQSFDQNYKQHLQISQIDSFDLSNSQIDSGKNENEMIVNILRRRILALNDQLKAQNIRQTELINEMSVMRSNYEALLRSKAQ